MYRGAAARFGSLCCCTEPVRSGNRVSGRRRREGPDDARARGARWAGPGLRHGRTGGWRWSRWWRRSSAGLGCPGWRERRGGRGRLARPPAASCDARNTYSDIHRKDPPPELRRNAPNDGKDNSKCKKANSKFLFSFSFFVTFMRGGSRGTWSICARADLSSRRVRRVFLPGLHLSAFGVCVGIVNMSRGKLALASTQKPLGPLDPPGRRFQGSSSRILPPCHHTAANRHWQNPCQLSKK